MISSGQALAEKENIMKLGHKIKQLRKQKNLSQEILAQSLGVSFQTISKWENEITMPDVMMIPAIAAFLM